MKPDTPDQVVAIQSLSERWSERAIERATIRERYAEKMREELAAHDRSVSRAMHKAMALGISKSRVGRLIGTADWKTIQNFLSLTAEEFAEETVDPTAPNVVQYATQVNHGKHEMGVTMLVRGDGTQVRHTPRQVKFTFQPQRTIADFPSYVAIGTEFDVTDETLLRTIRDDLQAQLPPGLGLKVFIRGVSGLDGADRAAAWTPPTTAAGWDAELDEEA